MIAKELRTEHRIDPLGIGGQHPFLSWICEGGKTQTACQIRAYCGSRCVWDSGKEYTQSMHARYPLDLVSRQKISWQVRVWDEANRAGAWSEAAEFEAGLFDASDWQGQWIRADKDMAYRSTCPGIIFRKAFRASAGRQARLYISAGCAFRAELNGNSCGESLAGPGSLLDGIRWYQVLDVTNLLREGTNELRVILCGGGRRTETFLCQLETEGQAVLISDEDWTWSGDGPMTDCVPGKRECYDARLQAPMTWQRVRIFKRGKEDLRASLTPTLAVRRHLPGKVITTPDWERVIDFGEVITGYVAMSLPNVSFGDKIRLTLAVSLDKKGNFVRTEEASFPCVEYTSANGASAYEPSFQTALFRYALIETEADLFEAEFTACVVGNGCEQTAFFDSSDRTLNKRFEDAVRVQRNALLDLPTDGTEALAGRAMDVFAAAETAMTFFDCLPVYERWLAEMREKEKGKGSLPAALSADGSTRRAVPAGDAVIRLPLLIAGRTGDERWLKACYGAMKRWLYRVRKDHPVISLGKDRVRWQEWLVDGTEFPDEEEKLPQSETPWRIPANGKVAAATAGFSENAALLARVADHLGKDKDATVWRSASELSQAAFMAHCTGDGHIESNKERDLAAPVTGGLLDRYDCERAVGQLNSLIVRQDAACGAGYRTAAGLGPILSRYGHVHTAYQMLLRKPDRENGRMAASASAGFLVTHMAGIQFRDGQLTLRPCPDPLVERVSAEAKTPVGTVRSAWHYDKQGGWHLKVTVPANAEARLFLPGGREVLLTSGVWNYDAKEI